MKTAALGEVAEFVNGVAFRPEDWHEDGLPIIRIQNLTDPGKPINYTTREVADKFRVRRGDLLVSWSATLGVFVWDRTDEALVNQHIFKVIPDRDVVDTSFLRHMLEGALMSMERHLHGAIMKHINRREFLATEIPLPHLDDQRRIAAILDHVSSLSTKQKKVTDEIGQAEQALFSDAFAGIETEELGEKLCFVTSGGRGWAKYYADRGSPFIRSLDVQMGRVTLDDLAYVAAPNNAEARRTRTTDGDVLLTITGSRIGRASVLPQDLAGGYISQHVAILRPDLKQLRPEFLAAFLCAKEFGQLQIRGAQYGQTKPGLNFDQIRRFRIPRADLETQENFCRKAVAVRNLAASAGQAAKRFDELSLSVQSRAFSGRL